MTLKIAIQCFGMTLQFMMLHNTKLVEWFIWTQSGLSNMVIQMYSLQYKSHNKLCPSHNKLIILLQLLSYHDKLPKRKN